MYLPRVAVHVCVCIAGPEAVGTDTFLRNTFSSGLNLGAKLHQHLDLPVLKGSEKSNYTSHKQNGKKQQIKHQIQRRGRKAPWLIQTSVSPVIQFPGFSEILPTVADSSWTTVTAQFMC